MKLLVGCHNPAPTTLADSDEDSLYAIEQSSVLREGHLPYLKEGNVNYPAIMELNLSPYWIGSFYETLKLTHIPKQFASDLETSFEQSKRCSVGF